MHQELKNAYYALTYLVLIWFKRGSYLHHVPIRLQIPARAIIIVNTLISLLISERSLKRYDDRDEVLKKSRI